jgi:hypothetical protein
MKEPEMNKRGKEKRGASIPDNVLDEIANLFDGIGCSIDYRKDNPEATLETEELRPPPLECRR